MAYIFHKRLFDYFVKAHHSMTSYITLVAQISLFIIPSCVFSFLIGEKAPVNSLYTAFIT